MANVGIREFDWAAAFEFLGSGKMFLMDFGDSANCNTKCAMDRLSRFAFCKHGADLSMSGLRDGFHGRVMVEVEVGVELFEFI